MYEWARNIIAHLRRGRAASTCRTRCGCSTSTRKGEVDHSRKVWTVLIFCIWHAIFVERSLDPGIQRNQSALLTKPVVGSMVS